MNKKMGKLLRPSVGVYFILMLCFCVAAFLFQQYELAIFEFAVICVTALVHIVWYNYRRGKLQEYVHGELSETEHLENSGAPFPGMLVRISDGGILFANDSFIALTGFHDRSAERYLQDVVPGLTTEWLASGKQECPYDVTLKGRRYRVFGSVIQSNDSSQTLLGMLYFADMTELYLIRDEYIRSRPVVALILVDNYDELTKNLTEGATSSLNARINDEIAKWTENYHGLLRRLEKNRFLFVFEKYSLNLAVEDKFSVLENIHNVTSPSGLPVSISIGIGVDADDFEEAYSFAALSIEMALSRGGDQAVIKDQLNFTFYGGRAKETEHSSKVRSRITANSLMELIGESSKVFIMGHRMADLDAVGAAMGVQCLCRKKGKQAYIVLDLEHNAAERILTEIRAVPAYKNLFISAQDAMLLCDSRSTLVVVDTNRPDQVESKPLLEAIPRVCVIDHHRRAADYIDQVIVNLHEPFASSASELVAELLQYAVEKEDVHPIEAKALLAGIFLDTKSFHLRTGERTFEAAAYLRQLGADTVEIKKLLQNDFQNTMEKYRIIKSARLYKDELAIAALQSGTTRTLAAQAADELLNISGITASFVLYPDGDQVIVSARSIGKANVQVILESLGGGGNSATAGAQIKNSTVKEVQDQLILSIDKYFDNM